MLSILAHWLHSYHWRAGGRRKLSLAALHCWLCESRMPHYHRWSWQWFFSLFFNWQEIGKTCLSQELMNVGIQSTDNFHKWQIGLCECSCQSLWLDWWSVNRRSQSNTSSYKSVLSIFVGHQHIRKPSQETLRVGWENRHQTGWRTPCLCCVR